MLEAHLFDKATSCRKRAFELLKVLAPKFFDIIDAKGAINLYKSVINAVTDEKPSIRKAAVELVVPLTTLYMEKLMIGADEEYEEL